MDVTKRYYQTQLDFVVAGEYPEYLILVWDDIEIHFFSFPGLKREENYGQVYIRTNNIDRLYHSLLDKKVKIHPNGHLEMKPWGQREFSLLDPDKNLLTFGESVRVEL